MQNASTTLAEQPVQKLYKLDKNVVGVKLEAGLPGRPMRFGRFSTIPQGTWLQECGAGYNSRTVQVRWRDEDYFVFLQDLLPPI